MAGGTGMVLLRPMTPADVDAAVSLARAQGWRDRRRLYDFVLRVSTCQPLVGLLGERVIATGLATANGPVGWLGSLVVDAAFRGRGIGRAMTEELCARLRASGCVTLSLEATDEGRPMYERMGFRQITSYHQLEAERLADPPALPDGATVRRLEPADLPAVCELDRQATAEDRHVALAVLAQIADGWVLERSGAPCGFLLPAERAYGAVVAPRFDDGLYLLDLHRHIIPADAGAHVRAGIADEHSEGWRELQARGWRETWRAPRLILGPAPDWRPDWIWGQINSAMG